jgi:hypothetical protein
MNSPKPLLVPFAVSRLVDYIRAHGHLACYVADDNLLAVSSLVSFQGVTYLETEFLPVDTCAVQDWLGY